MQAAVGVPSPAPAVVPDVLPVVAPIVPVPVPIGSVVAAPVGLKFVMQVEAAICLICRCLASVLKPLACLLKAPWSSPRCFDISIQSRTPCRIPVRKD